MNEKKNKKKNRHVDFFSFKDPKETKTNQLSIFIIYFHIIFIQHVRENSRKVNKIQIEINLPTAMAE